MMRGKTREFFMVTADICDLFIVESCTGGSDDFLPEGQHLVRTLIKMGKRPIFISVKNKKELKQALEIFKLSNYRYLHLSCHGSDHSLALADEVLSYKEFAQMSAGCFNDKRLFLSVCELGNEVFSNEVAMHNTAIQSIVAPMKKLSSFISESLWCAFYTSIFKPEISITEDSEIAREHFKEIKNISFTTIKRALGFVIVLYNEGLHISYHETSKHVLYHKKLIPGINVSRYSFFSKVGPYNSFSLK